MDPLSTLSSHCDHGEVYLDAGELELHGSRSFHKVPERFQRILPHFRSHPTRWTHYRHCPVTATTEKSTSTPENWNLMEVGRSTRFASIDSVDSGSIVSGGSENVLETAGISQKPRRMTDFHQVPVLRRRGRLLLSPWSP